MSGQWYKQNVVPIAYISWFKASVLPEEHFENHSRIWKLLEECHKHASG